FVQFVRGLGEAQPGQSLKPKGDLLYGALRTGGEIRGEVGQAVARQDGCGIADARTTREDADPAVRRRDLMRSRCPRRVCSPTRAPAGGPGRGRPLGSRASDRLRRPTSRPTRPPGATLQCCTARLRRGAFFDDVSVREVATSWGE